MKTSIRILLAAAVIVGLTAVNASAQATDSKSLTVNATVNSKAKLTLDVGAISFADADPGTVPTIPASSDVTVSASARTSAGSSVTVAVAATGDLTSSLDTITINNLAWTAAGAGFAGGTMALTDSALATRAGSGALLGTQTYTLANSWAYATGSYTTTITYTLTVP